MAERAVHFAVTTQSKPSIFEIVAQDSLAATLHPALKRCAEFLATNNPQYFGSVVIWFDEIYLCLKAVLEYYYIRNHGASFAEAFYGLQRICLKNSKLHQKTVGLELKKQYLSLLCLVLIPYIYDKAVKILNEKLTKSKEAKENEYRFYETILFTLNLMTVTWKSLNLLQLIAYASGKTIYHSPLLKLCKIAIVYGPTSSLSNDWTWSDIWNKKISISTILGAGLLRSFEVGAFFIQFLQSWSIENSKFSVTSLPVPPPPSLDSRAERYRGKCPICLQVWKTPTALQVSGYVFCYRCISSHLKQKLSCPITNYPATTDDLIRIFSNIT